MLAVIQLNPGHAVRAEARGNLTQHRRGIWKGWGRSFLVSYTLLGNTHSHREEAGGPGEGVDSVDNLTLISMSNFTILTLIMNVEQCFLRDFKVHVQSYVRFSSIFWESRLSYYVRHVTNKWK